MRMPRDHPHTPPALVGASQHRQRSDPRRLRDVVQQTPRLLPRSALPLHGELGGGPGWVSGASRRRGLLQVGSNSSEFLVHCIRFCGYAACFTS